MPNPIGFSLKDIKKEVLLKAPRIVTIGTEKAGKTTFGSTMPNVVFIPIRGEEGINSLNVSSFPVCHSFSDVIECFNVLIEEDHDYKSVVLDSTSSLQHILNKETCEQFEAESILEIPFGRGYSHVETKWIKLKEIADQLWEKKNMVITFIGHTSVRPFQDPLGETYDRYEWNIREKYAEILYQWADCILFVKPKNLLKERKDVGFGKEKAIMVSADQRCLYTKPSPAYPAGCRDIWGSLPNELPLSWKAFQEASKKIVDERKGKENG